MIWAAVYVTTWLKSIDYSSPVDGRWSNDLALIKIRRKGDGRGIQFSNQVAPACLPAYDSPQKSGTDCVVSGWGKTNGK